MANRIGFAERLLLAISGIAVALLLPSVYAIRFYLISLAIETHEKKVVNSLVRLIDATKTQVIECEREPQTPLEKSPPHSARRLIILEGNVTARTHDFRDAALPSDYIDYTGTVLNLHLGFTRGIEEMNQAEDTTTRYLNDFYIYNVFCRPDEEDFGPQKRAELNQERLKKFRLKLEGFLQQFQAARREHESHRLSIAIIAWADMALMAVGWGYYLVRVSRYLKQRKAKALAAQKGTSKGA